MTRRIIQLYRGTTAQNDSFTGEAGELSMDTTKNELRLHDGSTQGGHELVSVSKLNSGITNCITEIPQDIKLELNAGTLTLKAGSKIYIPDGFESDNVTLKFNEVILSDDKLALGTSSYPFLVFYNSGNDFGYIENITECFSGPTAPTTLPNMIWYDTTNNLIKRTSDYGSTWTTTGISLPVGAGKYDSGYKITNIFNGFGYIGSTVFVLPGVKGLIPNGRNADGTLNNTTVIIDSIKTLTETGTNNYKFFLNNNGSIGNSSVSAYDEENNYNYNTANGDIQLGCVCGTYTRTSGVISNFNTKTVFHAVDYNDSEYIANCAMPSDRYINLTLGASGTSYTAPADGYVCLSAKTSGTNFQMILGTDVYSVSVRSDSLNNRLLLPVRKGKRFYANYDGSLSGVSFRFVYAQGVK